MRQIDADALVEWLKRAGNFLKIETDHKRITHIIGKIIDHIEAMPTIAPAVDAVEVVRCRECKHSMESKDVINTDDVDPWCECVYMTWPHRAHEYCSYGDRR